MSKVIDKFPLTDVAYTLSGRSRFAQRFFCVVEKGKESIGSELAVHSKPIRAPLHAANVGFIFTGQGAQWHGMGAELFKYRVFRMAIEYLDVILKLLPSPPSWSLEDILSGDGDTALIQTAEVSQAVCTAVQVGLVDLLASWSVRPSGVAGHSSGEIAAAYAAGRISAAEAIVAAYLRGQAVSKNNQEGAMLAVGLGLEEVVAYVRGREDEVKIAAINSPGSVTLSGEETAIKQLSAAMTDAGIFNRQLKTGGNAYHSHHMLPIGRDYVTALAEGMQCVKELGLATQRYQHAAWVSSVTPTKSTTLIDEFATYWRANLESPVRFSEAIAGLVENPEVPIHVLIEIGPHPALKSPVEQILKAAGKVLPYASTLKRQENGQRSVLQLAGTLFCLNVPVNIAAVNSVDGVDGVVEHGCVCTALPPYQYTYGGLNYHESRASKEYRYRTVLRHDLLGSKVVGTAKLRPQWRNIIRIKDLSWLGDHRLLPDAVLPGAAYMAMAVEAASRIHDDSSEPPRIKGFSLADVAIDKSLVIPEDDYGVEVLTSLELASDMSTTHSPAWASFSISSVDRQSDEWAEHCIGRVKVVVEQSGDGAGESQEQAEALPGPSRAVSAKAWYKQFAQIGLGYGPAFQPLSNVSIQQASNVAAATLDLHTTRTHVEGGESKYPLHPAALDGAIQLGLIACHSGKHAEASTAFVPVRLARLYISNDIERNAGAMCTVVAHGERRGIRGAHLDFSLTSSNNEILARAEGLRCISFSSAERAKDRAVSSPFTRLVWKPDIRAMSNDQARSRHPPPEANVEQAPSWAITNRLAHFVVFSIYETFGRLLNGPKPSGDVGHFFRWVQRKGELDCSVLMNEARELAAEGKLTQKIEELANQAAHIIEVQIAKLLHDNMADILYERRTGIDVILTEDLLTPLYQYGLLMTGIYPQLHHVLAGLAYSNPNARILEIGGGTGGATRIAMKAFSGPNGIKAYRDYTFTDISAGFLSGARESLAQFQDMNFSVFDIEGDPVDQGYVEGTYDLIIACQVLHATSNMHRTLKNCRRLLKPGGKLVLVETNENFIVPGVVVGTFTGYWAGIPDGRVDAPFQSLSDWDRSLRGAGFSGLDVVLDDFPDPHNTTSVILSTVITEAPSESPHSAVYVVCDTLSPLVQEISTALEQRGKEPKIGKFDEAVDSVPPDSCIVTIFDEEHVLFNDGLARLQRLSQNSTKFIALTSSGTLRGRSPNGAVLSGLLRVLQNENPANEYISIDVDASDFDLERDDRGNLASFVVDCALRTHPLTSSETPDSSPQDREFSWAEGCLWVSRHVPDAGFHSQHGMELRSMRPEILPLKSQGPLQATFESPGVMSSLCFKPCEELLQPLQTDFIDVAVEAIGLDARDFHRWTGRVDEDYLSSEYAGTVTAIGATVNNFNVGDRVYGLGKGQFGNRTRVPAAMARKLSPSDVLEKMVSMPFAYAMAIYALESVARIRKGQSVLVHTNVQGIGLATINLALAKGADVFVMVETAEQACFLVEGQSMSASHVISSIASSTTVQRAARRTLTGKFDTIISTMGGARLAPFAHALHPLGHLIHLGHASTQATRVVNVETLPQNTSFCSIDPVIVLGSDLTLGAELMQAVDEYYRKGLIQPIQKVSVLDVA
ncbi:hypothetical protein NX059_011734 [Plenodomus lindquistii]|nr:hypothetical protein NX059_011734 [Plenodomus lindquistii]